MSSAHGSSHPTVALSPLLSPKIQIVQDSEEEEASSRGACRPSYRGNWKGEQRLRGTGEQDLSKAKDMERLKEKEEILLLLRLLLRLLLCLLLVVVVLEHRACRAMCRRGTGVHVVG